MIQITEPDPGDIVRIDEDVHRGVGSLYRNDDIGVDPALTAATAFKGFSLKSKELRTTETKAGIDRKVLPAKKGVVPKNVGANLNELKTILFGRSRRMHLLVPKRDISILVHSAQAESGIGRMV